MRIRTLTVLNTFFLAAIAIGLASLTHFGLEGINDQFSANQNFNKLSDNYRINVREGVQSYLDSGDAVALSMAEKTLQKAIEEVNLYQQQFGKNTALAVTVEQSHALIQMLTTDVRAAGKMSGNIELLLEQNEREQADSLDAILDHAEAVSTERLELSSRWADLAASGLYELNGLSLLRASYFNNPLPEVLKSINSKLALMKSISDQIKALASLPIIAEESNDLDFGMFDAEEEENKADDARSEFSFLLSRYPAEIKRTEAQQIAIEQTLDKVAMSLQQIDNSLVDASKVYQGYMADALVAFQNKLIILISFIVFVALVVDQIQRRVSGKIQQITPFFSQYSSGNFVDELKVTAFTLEIQSLIRSAGRLREYIIELLSSMRQQSMTLNKLSERINESSETISHHSQIQLDETTTIRGAIVEVDNTFQLIAESAAHAAESTVNASSSVKDGQSQFQQIEQNVTEMVTGIYEAAGTIEQLQVETSNINQVLTVIESIAEQTNLLALNAAIEAARAGEHGRGFSVVADEVRQLSHRTSESTQEIKTIISGLQSAASNSVAIMTDQVSKAESSQQSAVAASAALSEIAVAVSSIKDVNINIASMTEEQVAIVSDINQNISQIHNLSEQTVQSVADTCEQMKELNVISDGIQTSVGRF